MAEKRKAESDASNESKKAKVEGDRSFLDFLREHTTVVADSGEIEQIKKYKPTDATTNPSLIFKAAQLDEYKPLFEDALNWAKQNTKDGEDLVTNAMDKLAVNIGTEITKIVPGYVSTEVDARLSFDTEASVTKARKLISLYEAQGIKRDRILIKLASTWEGFQAAKQLEADNIRCNMTLLFSFAQAVAAAEAGVTLISPFVGRILDWYKKSENRDFVGAEDPGVKSVTRIYHYFKQHGYKTIVMGASFRNIGEIIELVGCDRLTISPNLLEELSQKHGEISVKLDPKDSASHAEPKITLTEPAFRYMLNDDAMATEKLAEGIRNFAKDIIALEKIVKTKLGV